MPKDIRKEVKLRFTSLGEYNRFKELEEMVHSKKGKPGLKINTVRRMAIMKGYKSMLSQKDGRTKYRSTELEEVSVALQRQEKMTAVSFELIKDMLTTILNLNATMKIIDPTETLTENAKSKLNQNIGKFLQFDVKKRKFQFKEENKAYNELLISLFETSKKEGP